MKDFQLTSATSSFSKFTGEEFKQLACRIHDDFYQGRVILFEGFNEMQKLYNAFVHQSEIIHDHNRRINEVTRAFDNLVDWKKYIKDTPKYFLVCDKLKLKKIQVSIETWENVCDLVESIIKDGQVDCM